MVEGGGWRVEGAGWRVYIFDRWVAGARVPEQDRGALARARRGEAQAHTPHPVYRVQGFGPVDEK